MFMVTITTTEYKDLIRKAAVYDIKKAELMDANYVSVSDKHLFSIPDKSEPTECECEGK